MTILTLLLLGAVALAPLALLPLRRVLADPVLPVAVLGAVLLAAAALAAAAADEAMTGWGWGAAVVAAVAAATTAGSPVVRGVFRVVRRELLPRRTSGAGPPGAVTGSTDQPVEDVTGRPENVLRGGAWIGYLERAAVAATLLAGWPEGIALVLAVKGVGRYAELRETNAPETFIIGTFASLLWAAAAAGTAHLLTS